jgi:PAS domain S-box-containing protein
MQPSSTLFLGCFSMGALLRVWLLCLFLFMNHPQVLGASPCSPQPEAINGLVDLRDWNFERCGPVPLDGAWAFRWGQFLDPAADPTASAWRDSHFLDIPGVWNGFSYAGRSLPGLGYATYSLKVRVPPDVPPLGLKIKDMATAVRVFVDSRRIYTAGSPGMDRPGTSPGYHPDVIDIPSRNTVMTITCHVANFHHWQGGAWESILLGPTDQLRHRRQVGLGLNLILLGGLFALGCYHLVLYLFRRKDLTPLLLGIFCLLMAFRTGATGERFFIELWPNADWGIMLGLVYTAFYISVPFIAYFVYRLFPGEINHRVPAAITALAVVFTAAVLVLPSHIYTKTMPVYQALTAVVFLYGIIGVTLAYLRGRPGANIFLAGFIILFAATINDILHSREIIQTIYVAPFGLFFFLFFQAVLLARRFAGAFATIEVQHDALEHSHQALRAETEERTRTAEALARSEQHYRTLFEASLEAMSLTREGRITDVNPAWLSLHGYARKENVLGQDALDFIHPDDRWILTERRAAWPKNLPRVYRLRDIRYQGGAVHVEVYSSEIHLKEGLFILATLRDIGEQVKAEKEKVLLENRLHRSEKMEALGTLAGSVAHDLNNILSGIVSYPDLLLMDMAEDDDLRHPLEVIRKSGERAAAIVEDLLSLARRNVTVLNPLDLNAFIREQLDSPELLALRREHPDVTLKLELSLEPLPILGASIHLSKALMNLLTNAAEAMPQGGTLTLGTATEPVGDAQAGQKVVVLTISDTGVGIAPEDREHIFEPFYTRKKMGRSGTGLGMAVVWGVVRDHNGVIDIQSEEGVGTTLILQFPSAEPSGDSEATAPGMGVTPGDNESILVVDDVAGQRQVSVEMLHRLNYRARAVESGEAAIKALASDTFDLLLLDMIMDPGIDGLETYRQALALRPGQRAVICSGFSENERVKAAQGLGAAVFLKKPYRLAELSQAVRTALSAEVSDRAEKRRAGL